MMAAPRLPAGRRALTGGLLAARNGESSLMHRTRRPAGQGGRIGVPRKVLDSAEARLAAEPAESRADVR